MRKNINKLFFGLTIVSSAILFNSCEKKILDVTPFASFTDATAFTTPERCLLALNGTYDAAQSGFYAGGAVRGYPFGAANIQQGDMRGEDMLNQALFFQITYEATYNDVSANNVFQFQTLYSLINKANLTMEGVKSAASGGVVTAAVGTQYEAECKFLRALAHHELLVFFARPYTDGNGSKQGIVYREFGINSDETAEQARALTRGTVAENYTKILADLDFAEANLPDAAGLKSFRASKGAAIALKMRVKQHMADWPGVIAEGVKLVPSAAPFISPTGGFRLTAAPGGAFTAPWQSDESMFSIRHDATDNASVNGGLANMAGNPAAAPAGVGGRGLVRISPIIWNAQFWLCDDLRRTTLTSGTGSGGRYTTKYKDVTTLADAAPQIRYAEVLLTLAEAEARNDAGVSLRALALLNAVRNRALADAATQGFTNTSFVAKSDLIQAILNERRIEFLAEGKRWADIHRLAKDPNFAPISGGGIPSKVGSGAATEAMFNCTAPASFARAVAAIPYDSHRFLWPIPLVEIQQNPNFAQNPGY
jgi:starch-binding outer membrane protein, SusD/RagB family